MNSLREISTSPSLKFLDVFSGFMSISKVQGLSNISWLLRSMIPIWNHCESQSQSFSPDFILNIVDDWQDCWLGLGQFTSHWTSCIDTETNVNETECRNWKMVFRFCLENCLFYVCWNWDWIWRTWLGRRFFLGFGVFFWLFWGLAVFSILGCGFSGDSAFCDLLLLLALIFFVGLDWFASLIVLFDRFSCLFGNDWLSLFNCLSHGSGSGSSFLLSFGEELLPFGHSIDHSRSSSEMFWFWSFCVFFSHLILDFII